MKDRIVSELSVLSKNPSESGYIDKLKTFFCVDDESKIARSATDALHSLLFNFSYFNVSTIDSFFQLVLRTFAAEIERPANFDIEMDEKFMISNAISTIIDGVSAGEHPMLKKWIKNYMTTLIEEGRPFNLFNRQSSLHHKLVEVMKALTNESYRLHAEEIDHDLDNPERLVALDSAIASATARILKRRAELAKQFETELTACDLAQFCHVSPLWLKDRMTENKGDKLGARMQTGIADPSKIFMKSRTVGGVKMKCEREPSARLLDLTREMLAYYSESQSDLNDLSAVRSGLFYMGILATLTQVVKNYCRDNNMIMISDTNELLNRIIGKDIAPFIYERLGVRLKHFLIDEFQDTSKLQWLNLKPLLIESLSWDHDNLIIGDEKQCIYRFRNSAPELLGSEVKSEIDDGRRHLSEKGLLIEENCNWRSAPQIIRFNNSLFYSMGRDSRFPQPNAYCKVIQEVSEKHLDDVGYVEVTLVKPASRSRDKAGQKTKKPSESFTDRAVSVTLNHLRRMLRSYRAGDIAILVRTKTDAKVIIDAMLDSMNSEGGLPRFNIISNDALKISSSPAVKLIVNILRLVDSPETTDVATDEMKGRKFKTKNDTARLHHRFELLLNSEEDSGKALAKALEENEEVDSILKYLTGRKSRDIISLTEHIISLLPENMCKTETVFLTAFQDQVLAFQSKGAGDLHSFLQWWDNTGISVALDTPEELDALTVTTIHKSKGIEYGCVIIPFADWSFVEDSGMNLHIDWYRSKPLFGVNEELIPRYFAMEKKSALRDSSFAYDYEEANRRQRIDNINLTYVAFTRAVKELVVVAKTTESASESVGRYIEEAILTMTPGEYEKCGDCLDAREVNALITLSDKLDSETMTFRYGVPEESAESGSGNSGQRQSNLMPAYETRPDDTVFNRVKVRSDEDFDPENARVEGDFMHEVLRMVVRRDDLAYACRLRAEQVNLPDSLAKRRYEILAEALADQRVAPWFENFERVVAERPIAIAPGETKRPDRVVWTADGHVDVIDYKFGEPEDRHKTQVREYVNFLRQGGYDNVRGFLWYPLDDNRIITVDDGNFSSLF